MSYKTYVFLVELFFRIIVQLIAVIFGIKAVRTIKKNNGRYREEDKYNRFIAISTLCGSIVVFVAMLHFEVPEPEIYIKSYEPKNYNEEYEMEIKNVEIFDNYYNTNAKDPENPENGVKYTGSFKVHNPTLVFAKSKFLWLWSDKSQLIYISENLSYNNSIQQNEIQDTESVIPNEKNSETEKQIKDDEPTETESQPKETEQHDTQPDNTETETQTDSVDTPSQDSSIDSSDPPSPQPSEPTVPNEGINPSEGSALMAHINQYRTQSGISELTWDSGLEQEAQNIATAFATGGMPVGDMTYIVVGRQCNGAKNAQRAVSDWITGNDYIPSEADSLLNSGYTQMGGALYYLPNGNQYGYHYFWIVCLR